MRRPKVYISGPISIGDKEDHLRRSCEVQRDLIADGFAPFNPMLTIEAERRGVVCDHDTWMEVDKPWVTSADVLFRMPGASKGADLEVNEAIEAGIPVFLSLFSLRAWFGSVWCRTDHDHDEPSKMPPDSLPARLAAILADDPHPLSLAFYEALVGCAELHAMKQADYGRSGDPFANVRASAEFGIAPWLGTVMRMNDKVSRLKSFAQKGELKNESVEDSLRDISVYALIALILFREGQQATPNPTGTVVTTRQAADQWAFSPEVIAEAKNELNANGVKCRIYEPLPAGA